MEGERQQGSIDGYEEVGVECGEGRTGRGCKQVRYGLVLLCLVMPPHPKLGPLEPLPILPSARGRDWTVVTVVTMVPSGMMVRSNSIFLVGVILGRGVEGVGVPRFRGEPSS